jgi:hypothetical protein
MFKIKPSTSSICGSTELNYPILEEEEELKLD